MDAYGFFLLILFNKELTKSIHQKTQHHHATPTYRTIREKHAKGLVP
jgi:hypothetical protein